MRLQPGLVGGHCIGVDPYYLLHRSARAGHIPDIIRTAREINDGMPRQVVQRLARAMIRKSIPVQGAKVLVMGATFKENCPDIRNTKVIDMVEAMKEWGMDPVVTDPQADPGELKHEYDMHLVDGTEGNYDVVVLAVPHAEFLAEGAEGLKRRMRPGGVLFDMKAVLPKADSDLRM